MTNPLFVRGHDFLGMQGANHSWQTTEMYGTGWPSNAGGRLVGSLAGLPYALAEAEQNFLVPTQTQALIWGDLVPQMMLTRESSALVERDAGADALGRDAHALRRSAAGRSRAESGDARSRCSTRSSRIAQSLARVRWSTQLLAAGDVRGRARSADAVGDCTRSARMLARRTDDAIRPAQRDRASAGRSPPTR